MFSTDRQHRPSVPDPIGDPPRVRVADRRRRLSPSTVGVAVASVIAGVVTGAVQYAHRSAVVEKHTSGTEAWTPHAIVAVAAAALLAGAYLQHRRHGRGGEAVLLAPFGRRAASRIAVTWRHPGPHAAASVPLLLLCVYSGWRTGEQVTAGLDPNFTANAWGGPSYLGAMVCHYLDGGLIVAVAAWLLSRVLVSPAPTPRSPR